MYLPSTEQNGIMRHTIDKLPAVNAVELYHVRLPLQHPFQTSFGRETHRDSVLVRLRTDHGSGWGEAPVGRYPRYTHESSRTAWYILSEFLAPGLLKAQPDSLEEWHRHHPFIRGHAMARSSVVMALADLAAKRRELPLGTFYGADRNEAYSGISIGLQDRMDDLLRRVEEALKNGYRRIKVKVEPGRDKQLLEVIRNEYPDIDLMADGNGGYREEHLDELSSLDAFDLMMLEQPFPPSSFSLHAQLQERMDTPICLDESIEQMEDAQRAYHGGSARVINVKQPRVAGPMKALQIYDFCVEHGVEVFCGGLLETGIGRAHNVGLASLPAFEMPGDLSESRRYFPEDVVEPEFTLTDRGTLKLPENDAGIGVTPKMDFIREMSVRSVSREAGEVK